MGSSNLTYGISTVYIYPFSSKINNTVYWVILAMGFVSDFGEKHVSEFFAGFKICISASCPTQLKWAVKFQQGLNFSLKHWLQT